MDETLARRIRCACKRRNRTRSVPTLNSQKEPHIDEINVNSQRERNVERIRQIGLKAMRSEEMGAKIDGIAR